MDEITASRMAKEFIGKTVGDWKILDFIGNGKSAMVFEGERSGQKAAIKVLDNELVERYGQDIQLRRINRELTLIGKSHPNLVKIFDGGVCKSTNSLFIVMEFIESKNLKDLINFILKAGSARNP